MIDGFSVNFLFEWIEKLGKAFARFFRKVWLWGKFHWKHRQLTDWQVMLLSKALLDTRDTVRLVAKNDRSDDVGDAIQRFLEAELAFMTHSDLTFRKQYMDWVNKRRTKVISRARRLKEQPIALDVEKFIRPISPHDWMVG